MDYSEISSEEALFTDQEDDTSYEDLDTTTQSSQSSMDARTLITWSQRLLITNRVLTIVHIALNLRLILFSWALYAAVGRFFIMLPLALESILSLIFEAVGTFPFAIPWNTSSSLHLAPFPILRCARKTEN